MINLILPPFIAPGQVVLPPHPIPPIDVIVNILVSVAPVALALLKLYDYFYSRHSHQWLREQREELGLSQEEVAEIFDVALRTIQRLENGHTRRPQIALRKKLETFNELCQHMDLMLDIDDYQRINGGHQMIARNMSAHPRLVRWTDLEGPLHQNLYNRYIEVIKRKGR